jgi:hypothetical protein
MEDYRWAILRGRMKPWQFQRFNLLFIVLYQNALLVLITLPRSSRGRTRSARPVGRRLRRAVRRVPRRRDSSPTSSSGTSTAPRPRRRTPRARFRHDRALPLSRHPNFFFEQAQWWTFYALGATAAAASGSGVWGGALNWTILGAALLSLLFIGRRSSPNRSRREVPRVRRLPADDVDARAAATASGAEAPKPA